MSTTPELIHHYQAGQTDLFDALFERYKDYVYRVAYSYAQNVAEAKISCRKPFLTCSRPCRTMIWKVRPALRPALPGNRQPC